MHYERIELFGQRSIFTNSFNYYEQTHLICIVRLVLLVNQQIICIQKENILTQKLLKRVLLGEQPPYLFLCKRTLTCITTLL